MHKVISVSLFTCAFALTATPAFAGYSNNNNGCNNCDNDRPSRTCCPSVDVSNMNVSKVSGVATSTAITGQNKANRNFGVGKIDTGNANAGASLTQQIGYNETKLSPIAGSVKVKNMNMSSVNGSVDAYAGTGDNVASGNGEIKVTPATRCMPKVTVKDDGRGEIETGTATAVTEMVQLVGSNLTVVK